MSSQNPPTQSLSCKLSTAAFRERKALVLKSLKARILHKKEMPNGFAYQFEGTDEDLDELMYFIKTERECCNFFVFKLSIAKKDEYVWLEISGPEGVKAFIEEELGF